MYAAPAGPCRAPRSGNVRSLWGSRSALRLLVPRNAPSVAPPSKSNNLRLAPVHVSARCSQHPVRPPLAGAPAPHADTPSTLGCPPLPPLVHPQRISPALPSNHPFPGPLVPGRCTAQRIPAPSTQPRRNSTEETSDPLHPQWDDPHTRHPSKVTLPCRTATTETEHTTRPPRDSRTRDHPRGPG